MVIFLAKYYYIMHEQIRQNFGMAIAATIGVAAMSFLWFLFFRWMEVPDWIAIIVCSLSFALFWTPIPFHVIRNTKLLRTSTYDALTGLYNRPAFLNQLDKFLAQAKSNDTTLHLILLDLNKFKEINDTMGHDIGDELLINVADSLRGIVRKNDVVARLGGDEFAVLLRTAQGSGDDYKPIVGKISKAINEPICINDTCIYVGVGIGVASYPAVGKKVTATNLLRFADIAMYAAKKEKKEFSVYHEDYDTFKESDLSLLGEFRNSITNNDFELWYQPKKCLQTSNIVSAECLVRWKHPRRGFLMPDSFIPIAESSGAIKYLTQVIIKEAALGYHQIRAAGHDISISVNISPNDITDPAITQTIIKSIVAADMLPNKLILEVTETAIMVDTALSFRVLVALESLGIKLSIDDFGTGHSSLLYLKNFPIHEIKLDKSFIADIEDNNEGYNIVRSTIDLAHTLDAITVAEGVETYEEEDVLRMLGCDQVQGYYIAKPMPLDKFITWLDEYTFASIHTSYRES
jgi:diguanylate cyclase (GGDEF)-like protein